MKLCTPSLALSVGLALIAFAGASGCAKITAAPPENSHAAAKSAPEKTSTPAPEPLSAAELNRYQPNEAGVVPILEYHDINDKKNSMSRSAKAFRADLERLYREGYRPISLSDFLDNRIAVPAGKSPVVFTFDDARRSQFSYRDDGTPDPDCAVAILKAFAAKRPDFPVRATFFVLPEVGFEQKAWAARKMQELLAMGCEIGNHTITHRILKRLSDEEVQKELATCAARVREMAPQAKVDAIALPFGIAPKNRALLAAGEYRGMRYAHRASLLVGANPAPAPVSPQYDPMNLPRIQACEGDFGITYWLDSLKRNPKRRYVSDGDPNAITVPKANEDKVDAARLNGRTLRTY